MTDFLHDDDGDDAFGSPELVAYRDAAREKSRRSQEETNALLGIIRTWGNDTEDALRELRGYLALHPDSCDVHFFWEAFCKNCADGTKALWLFGKPKRGPKRRLAKRSGKFSSPVFCRKKVI